MLPDYKPGDWVKLNIEKGITRVGTISEIDSKDSVLKYCSIKWYVNIDTENNYSKLKYNCDGSWNPNNPYLTKHEPTIEEIFKIKQTLEKE